MQHTIESLRRGGYKVRVIHGEVETLPSVENNLKQAADKYTFIQITEIATSMSVEGWAFCSKKDNYSRKIGNRIALGRALENLEQLKSHCAAGLWYNPEITLLSYTSHDPSTRIDLKELRTVEKFDGVCSVVK
jgi:hypothetical protein